MRKLYGLLILLPVFVYVACKNEKAGTAKNTGNNEPSAAITEQEQGVVPIDIKSNEFFWLLQPWKEGKLATVDGWGRFSEISFDGADKINIRYLVNFPRMELDRKFIVWPEADLWYSQSARMDHVAYMGAEKKIKSFVPFFTGNHMEFRPVLLDVDEGIIAFCYGRRGMSGAYHYVIYNYKQDIVVYETPEDIDIGYMGLLDNRNLLGYILTRGDTGVIIDYFIYNWKTGEKERNDLTNTLTGLNLTSLSFGPTYNLSTVKRYLITQIDTSPAYIKIDWNEHYKNVKITPLDFFVPKEKTMDNAFISPNGEWGVVLFGRYWGIYGEQLNKRVFFHVNDRYPGGMSMPVILDEYEEYEWDYGAFVNHPVHGMCYAMEYHEKNQLYLRLYKMDDILAEINRQQFEKVKDIVSEKQ